MKTMAAAKFKEQCLSILDRIDPAGITITKHGKPVAKLLPVKDHPANFIGCMKGHGRLHGDILSTGLKWDAES